MPLLGQLACRFLVVGCACLLAAMVWIMADARAGLQSEAEASAARVASVLSRQPGLGSAESADVVSAPSWRSASVVLTVLPGICVVVDLGREPPRRLCSGWDGIGAQAPTWFRAAFERLFDSSEPIRRAVTFRNQEIGTVTAAAERDAAAARAWRQVRISAGIAAAMALATGVLGALAAARLLSPVGQIVRGLTRLEDRDQAAPLPRFATREFNRIGQAVNDLSDALRHSRAEQVALTLRLFQVQEDERRTLARDLHDEFGQCLTASAALAGAIEAGASSERADIAADARAIGGLAARMMTTLRGALARLEPPELAERGIEGSLRRLVSGWSTTRGDFAFHLDMDGDLASLPPQAALSLYRIAQELLTNAVRHGTPSRVFVRVSRSEEATRPVTLVVDDDGGGDPAMLARAERTGRGLLGIRERVAAFGGSFRIGGSASGIRACAILPTAFRP